MVKTGSPDVTFNAHVVPGADTPVSRDLQFIMGPKVIAHPSNKPGAVMEIDATYQNHFEILQTTLPRVSIKLNNPVMKIHTQVFKWASHANSSIYVEVPLIVSGEPLLTLLTKHSKVRAKWTTVSIHFVQHFILYVYIYNLNRCAKPDRHKS